MDPLRTATAVSLKLIGDESRATPPLSCFYPTTEGNQKNEKGYLSSRHVGLGLDRCNGR
jgi:hypothetical protein